MICSNAPTKKIPRFAQQPCWYGNCLFFKVLSENLGILNDCLGFYLLILQLTMEMPTPRSGIVDENVISPYC